MTTSTSTVIFTDLVGSTELAIELGKGYDEVRRSHDRLLRAAVESNGGAVVKGLGDGVMATFTAAADAVAAARAVQVSIHRFNRQHRGPVLSVRVGLAVGDITFDGGDCFGEPVIVAARLCAAAEGDQILAAETVRALVGGRRAIGFADAGERELKGLPEPVDAVEVLWERAERSPAPLPPRLAADDAATSFVGRTSELSELDHAYRSAVDAGRRQVVLVGGEPGLGKTTLVSEAVRRWHDDGATVAMGRCDEDVRASYRPFIDALGHLVTAAPPEVLHAHVERHGAGVLSLVPALAGRVERLPEPVRTDPETERFLLFSAVDDLLAGLAEVAPVVLFLDDLHWADAGTASLLRSLAAGDAPARLLVVGTFRNDELAADEPMGQAVAAFRRIPAVSRLQLDGLRTPDVVELVARWTGSDTGSGAEQLAAAVVAETGGNAFFVTEVIRHLEDTGQLADLTGVAGGPTVLPDSLREVLGERVARLGSAADAVLGVAAVIGSEFTLSLLGAVTGHGDEKLLQVLDAAGTAALVREVADAPGRFVFTHALVQHAILANLGATREASVHRRVAEALESHDVVAPVAELAHHWLQATRLSDNTRARDWARQAGEAALAALAPGDAVTYFRQALLLHDQVNDGDDGTRIDLLVGLGAAERQAGDPEHRETLLRACRLAGRTGDGERLAAAALANNGGTFATFGGVDDERVAMLEAAIAGGGVDVGVHALLLGTLANELTYSGDLDRRRQLADDAVRAARASGDPTLLLRVMNLAFYPLWIPQTLHERLAMTEESRALLESVVDPVVRYWSAMSSSMNLLQAGRVAEADPLLADAVTLGDRIGQPALQWRTRHTMATRQVLAGDHAGAEAARHEALELGERARGPEASLYFKSQGMCVHWLRGTMTELSGRIRGVSPRPPSSMASLCLVLAESGRLDEARAVLDEGTAAGFAQYPYDPAWSMSLAFLAEGAVLTDHRESAPILHGLLAPYADQFGFDGVTTVGCLEHYVGALATMLGRHDEAVERLGRAVAAHEAAGAPFFAARGRERLGAALLQRGQPGDAAAASAELARAVAIAEDHGFELVRQRAAALAGNP